MYRSIAIGLHSHPSLSEQNCPLIVSGNHLKLLKHYREHSGSNKYSKYIWVIFDGLFCAVPMFQYILSLEKFQFIHKIFIVGDLGSISELNNFYHTKIELLLDPQHALTLIDKLAKASSIERLEYGLLPSWLYTINDCIKSPLDPLLFPSSKLVQSHPLIFAGSDGKENIQTLFRECCSDNLSEKLFRHLSLLIHSALENIGQSSLHDLTERICRLYFHLVCCLDEVVVNFTKQWKFYKCGLKVGLYKSVFRLCTLHYLIETNRVLAILYDYRNLNIYLRKIYRPFIKLDFGSINGFEELYPRQLDCALGSNRVYSLNKKSRQPFSVQGIDHDRLFHVLSDAIKEIDLLLKRKS